MDTELLIHLLSGKRKPKQIVLDATTGYAILRDGSRVSLAVAGSLGHFDSKAGSAKRSRKGRTYRAPNGYAKYVPASWIDNDPSEVVGYLAKPS